MARRIVDMGDRVLIAVAAMEFAGQYSMKQVQLYDSMVAAVAEEPKEENADE
jgi:hypothetical protein